MALNQIISEGIKDGEVKAADIATDAVGITDLAATGTASSSTYLRGDNTWSTPPDTDTVIGGGTGVDFNDNVITYWGTGDDLKIFHNATNSYIQNQTGNLVIAANRDSDEGGDIWIDALNGERSIKCVHNGAVELYYDGAKKLETVTGGATITGVCTATSFAGDGSSLTGLAAGATGGNSGANAIFWENEQTVTHDYTISNNKNAGTWGPVTINSGVTVTVGDGEYWTIM